MKEEMTEGQLALKIFLEANDKTLCPRCKCCEMVWEECWNCGGEGTDGHDCGEDCCCCADPEDNVRCDICNGKGGYMICIGHCDENGKHQVQGIAEAK